jgi:hypothetical protein
MAATGTGLVGPSVGRTLVMGASVAAGLAFSAWCSYKLYDYVLLARSRAVMLSEVRSDPTQSTSVGSTLPVQVSTVPQPAMHSRNLHSLSYATAQYRRKLLASPEQLSTLKCELLAQASDMLAWALHLARWAIDSVATLTTTALHAAAGLLLRTVEARLCHPCAACSAAYSIWCACLFDVHADSASVRQQSDPSHVLNHSGCSWRQGCWRLCRPLAGRCSCSQPM